MELKKLFTLTWKRFLLIIILWIVSVVIHNFGSALIEFEEPVFFIIAIIIIPIYFIISLINTIIQYFRSKK